MLRAYKYRIYPMNEQKTYLAKIFGCTRLIYNLMLSDRIDIYNKYKDDKEALKNKDIKHLQIIKDNMIRFIVF